MFTETVQQPKPRQLGAVGEAAVKLAFLRLGWGVVDAPSEHDVGTDLYLNVRDDQLSDVGLMMGVQVKSGPSWFEQARRDEAGNAVGWWFREGRNHGTYWLAHILPHLVVLHDNEAGVSYWANITADSVVATGRGIKVFVPRANTVDGEHREALFAAASDSGKKSSLYSCRRQAIRQADYALVHAINVLSAYSGKSPLEADKQDFKIMFASELRALHGLVGRPSIEVLSDKTGYVPIRIREYLSGKYLPSRIRVVAIVQAMTECARDRNIDITSHQFDVRTWERKWRIAKKSGMQKVLKNKAQSKTT